MSTTTTDYTTGSPTWTDTNTDVPLIGVQVNDFSGSGGGSYTAASNVRSGTDRGDGVIGTLAVPAAGDVRSGVAVDAGAGSLTVPSLANTKIGVSGDGGTGTYDGSDRWTDPGEANVASGVQYKANSTTNNKTGTLTGGSTTVIVIED